MDATCRRSVDVAVIGGGVVGLATADALTQQGADVLCIEAGRPGGAQSAGRVRLLRPHHDYVEMIDECVEAVRMWRAWEQRWSRRLLGDEGVVMAGAELGDAPAELAAAGVRAQVTELTPQLFRLLGGDAGGGQALVERESAGALRAARTISLLARSLEPRLLAAHVIALGEHERGVAVLTNETRIDAAHVVVCAGSTTAALADACGVDIPLERDLHVRLAYRMVEPGPVTCWIDRRERFGPSVYGLPVGTTGLYAIGIGGRDGDIPLARDEAFGGARQVDELEATARRLHAYVQRALPGLHPTIVGERRCLVTQLPWGGDHIGVWRSPERRISFLVGNNMFKFAPLLGDRLARIAQGEPIPRWLDPDVHAAAAPGAAGAT